MTIRVKTVLVADDDRSIRTVLRQALTRAKYRVLLTDNATELWNWVNAGRGDVVITDISMPNVSGFEIIPKIKILNPTLPIIVISALSNFKTALRAEEENVFEYLSKPFDLDKLVATVQNALDSRQTEKRLNLVKDFGENPPLMGKSLPIQNIYRIIARLTNSDLNIVLFGETGTGKRCIARALHDHSYRNSYPFVSINLSVLSEEEVHESFFSCNDNDEKQASIFERCENGTLYIENVELLSSTTQKKIINWIENQSKLTELHNTDSSTRIVSATRTNLFQLVQQGKFRKDLYYYLNVVPVIVPSLRERSEDIPSIARFFMSKYNVSTTIVEDGIEVLKRHAWPGNIKELENFIRRLAVLYPNQIVSEDLVKANLNVGLAPDCETEFEKSLPLSILIERYIRRYFLEIKGSPVNKLYAQMIAEIEKPLIEQTLLQTQGNQIKASAILGINRNTLRKRIKELNIFHK